MPSTAAASWQTSEGNVASELAWLPPTSEPRPELTALPALPPPEARLPPAAKATPENPAPAAAKLAVSMTVLAVLWAHVRKG